MSELAKHIELLLLDNDCVIVPGFGGFTTHLVGAVYYKEERLFLPPLRAVGFNPQLKLNDSLLAQSYVEAYDISYPDALLRIESDVKEMKEVIANEGSYELPSVGVIIARGDETYDFKPCQSGLLTPNLYALSSFEMPMLRSMVKGAEHDKMPSSHKNGHKHHHHHEGREIRIDIDSLRRTVATAAVILCLVLFSIPLGDSSHGELRLCSLDSNILLRLIPHIEEKGNLSDLSFKEVKKPTLQDSIADAKENRMVEDAFNIKHGQKTTDSLSVAKKEKVMSYAKKAVEEKGSYVIVLASHVTKSLAEEYVSRLKSSGVTDARILEGRHLKVVCGSFQNIKDAQNELTKLKSTSKEVTDAWFLQI